MKKPVIFIVIPVHNRKNFTRQCLLSLRKQTFQNFKVVIVDDGSTDGTGQMIMDEFPEVILLKGDGNLWWTGATNLGVKHVLNLAKDDDYVITLNDDTVVHADYIQTLLDSASKYPRSLIGSIAVNDEDESVIADAGVRINWLTAKFTNLGKGQKYNIISKSPSLLEPVDVLPGRGTLIPVRAFRDAGLYDVKRMPHYGADYEFARRANIKGYNLLINYKAIVICKVKYTGLNNRVNKIGLGDLIKSFFSIRSPNNLKYRLQFARLCCVGWRFPVFYAFDVSRLIIGSLLAQIGFHKRQIL